MIILIAIVLVIIAIIPFAGVCLSVFLDYWGAGYQVGSFPFRNYVVPVLLLVVMARILLASKIPRFTAESSKLLAISFLMVVWAGFLFFIRSADMRYYLGRILVPFCVMCCSVYFVATEKKIKIFMACIACAAMVSSIIAIFQYFDAGWAWELHARLNPWVTGDDGNADILARARVPGLANYSISLGYSLCALSPLFLAVAKTAELQKSQRFFWGSAFIFTALASMFSLSRSAMAGVGIGIIIVFSKGRNFSQRIKIALLAFTIISAIFVFAEVKNRLIQPQAESRGTIPRMLLGVKMALDNPVGTGWGSTSAFAESFENNYPSIYGYEGAQAKNIAAAHNQFVNTSVYYGYLGLLGLTMFYVYAYRIAVQVQSRNYPELAQNIAVGLQAGIVSYVVHSLFHNAGPFIGEVYGWYLLALVLIVPRAFSNDTLGARNRMSYI